MRRFYFIDIHNNNFSKNVINDNKLLFSNCVIERLKNIYGKKR